MSHCDNINCDEVKDLFISKVFEYLPRNLKWFELPKQLIIVVNQFWIDQGDHGTSYLIISSQKGTLLSNFFFFF